MTGHAIHTHILDFIRPYSPVPATFTRAENGKTWSATFDRGLRSGSRIVYFLDPPGCIAYQRRWRFLR